MALAAVLGCLSGGTGPSANDSGNRSEEDAFIKDYLANQKAKPVVDVPTRVVNTKIPTTTTSSTTMTLRNPTACPYQCCPENDTAYAPKGCGPWFVCDNGTCGDRPCPFECCDLGMYTDKLCRSPLECVNSSCLKPDCPDENECCNETDYRQVMPCGNGAVCLNSTCLLPDSDHDGLSDVAETRLGTNFTNADTDGDGLSDYDEVVRLRTNPLDPNTDQDRYPDALDRRPNITDSAVMNISVSWDTVTVNWTLLHALMMHLDFNQSAPGPNETVADFDSSIWVANTGTDYTSFVNYTYSIGILCAPGVDVRRRPFVYRYLPAGNITENYSWIGAKGEYNDTVNSTSWVLKDVPLSAPRLDAGERYTRSFHQSLLFRDIPENASAAVVTARGCGFNVSIKDVRYERF